MRAIVATAMLCMTGCQVVFPLDDPERVVPQPCRHEGLLLCLAFEGGGKLGIDDSPRLLDATVNGVARTERLTPLGETEAALDLSATSEVVFPYNDAFDLPGPMSYDIWFQFGGFVPGFVQYILDNPFQWGISIRADRDMVDCTAALLVDGNPARFQSSFVDVEPARWHHLVCVMDPVTTRKWKAYLNGQEVIQTIDLIPDEHLALFGTEFMELGNPGVVPTQPPLTTPFIGQIDNFRVWDRALDDDTIRRFSMGDEAVE